ncbi:MAG: hypothetical protein ACRDKL_08770, partial [Solirubrobacteraceae bacterium]
IQITTNGAHNLMCEAEAAAGTEGEAAMPIWIDTQHPTVTLGGAQPGTWYSNQTPATTATVTATGSEPVSYSGIASVACTVNGADAFNLPGVGGGVDNGSFVLTANGKDTVSCQAITVAGATGPPAVETIDVDNPNLSGQSGLTQYGSSPLIDHGDDPFANGPSQTTWYRTPESVTVTADETGGGAPIAAITCVGAPTNGDGAWPNAGGNMDPSGGESVRITVQPPGGDLVCTATDTAGNTYPLGSYEFQLDDTAPSGAFVSQSRWPDPDQLELKVTDAGSGVAYVRVYAQLNGSHTAARDLGRASNADGAIWTVPVPDGVLAPGVYTFNAQVGDQAGNSGVITAGPAGRTEQLMLPLRQQTTVTMQAANVAATEDAQAPSVLAPELGVPPTGSPQAGARAHTDRRGADIPLLAARARRPQRFPGKAIQLPYGRALTVHGRLRDDRADRPIAGATIKIYQQIAGTRTVKRIGRTKTNWLGGYSYRIRPGASRVVFVAYPGTARLRSAVAQLAERSGGSVTLRASGVRAGGQLTLGGRVLGGHIPRGGVAVTINYQQVGLPGRGTFGTVRTGRRGTWRFVQPFNPATAGLAYRVWVTVPSPQAGWPYLSAQSAALIRRIAG